MPTALAGGARDAEAFVPACLSNRCGFFEVSVNGLFRWPKSIVSSACFR